MVKLDYHALGFRSGLEIHYQLMTEKKLFCRCPAGLYSREYDAEVLRHMRPTLSELGEYDGTALMEFKTKKEVVYRLKNESVCTYEMDDTPPFELNQSALDIALEIALLLKCNIVGELHIIRKQYLDGSIPTGFQRTAIVGIEGMVPYEGREVGIIQLALEEDACREVSDRGHRITFKTDRLGMPLVEVVTHPHMLAPREVAEVGERLGRLLRVTGKVRRGIGSVRQDVNVSIRGGTRVEIKGVPRVPAFERLTHNEALRQKALLEIREELEERGITYDSLESRSANLKEALAPTDNATLREALSGGKELAGVVLRGLRGLLSYQTQEGPRDEPIPFLRDFAGRVRVIACLDSHPNLFCEEVPHAEGLTERDWRAVREVLEAGDNDSLFVVWGPSPDVRTAIQEIEIRAREACLGVPNETRQALKDGTTDFERILPGPDRMYPDTDSPYLPISETRIEGIRSLLPEAPWVREERYRALGLPEDVICPLAISPRARLFERLTGEFGVSPMLVATTLTRTLKTLRRKGLEVGAISEGRLLELFSELKAGSFFKEAIPEVLAALAEKPDLTASGALSALGLKPLGRDELEALVDATVRLHGESPMHNPEKRHHLLMGLIMKKCRGRCAGRDVAKVLAQRLRSLKALTSSESL